MKKIARKNLIYIVLAILAVCAIIVLAWFAPLQRTAGVIIVSETSISQGAAENNTEMESVKVHGTFWNEGDLVAKNLTATVIFTDAAHNKVVRKTVPVGGDLLPNKGLFMEFDSEYLRERTVPKTEVNVTIQYDWMENGLLKTTSTPSTTPAPIHVADKINLNIDYNGRQMELTKGQTLNVTLEANPSTGYSWEVVELNKNIIHQIGEAEYQQISNFTSEHPMVGAPVMQTFQFEVINTGQTTLKLVYRRSWEKDVAPLNNFSIDLAVR
ncbi:MAG: protease inhibitor I42 family protein [Candidatus Methanoperedens sp.]|nr:protease inhibitor I42 family protein [Candidatus Methanoperedens sp.]MCZ7395772.1 protease inhibitor I42 family protein [Candidatus Methanoperedens sp.]